MSIEGDDLYHGRSRLMGTDLQCRFTWLIPQELRLVQGLRVSPGDGHIYLVAQGNL